MSAASVRWTWWAFATGVALVAAGQWLHAPSVEYLVGLLVATAAALLLALRVASGARRWALASTSALVIAGLSAGVAQRQLVRVDRHWDDWRREASARSLAALKSAIDGALESSRRSAARALSSSSDRSEAFTQLGRLPDPRFEQAVVVYRAGLPFAWAGTTRIPPNPSHDGVSVIASPFYLSLQYVQRQGPIAVSVLTLLGAVSPGDRLASPVANQIADATGMGAFSFEPPSDSGGPDVLRYATDGGRLFDVRTNPLVQGEVRQRVLEQADARFGLALAVALICFIIGVWRATRDLTRRVGALAVALATTALVPLNQYSNLTRLFDPAFYFTPKGGPLTGNAGALAITSAIVLLGILGALRRRATMARWQAVVTVLFVAGVGPFLLRDLARGVQVPAHGVDAPLWLIWEIPLFLAAVTVLLAGTAAGGALLGPRRGVAPWAAPLFAAVAAVLASPFWQAPGRWPWWYTILWVVAIGLLALSRRTRFVIASAATVAALGATTLVWARAAKGRVDAAERDVAGLSQVDTDAAMLLQRFGASMSDVAPLTRVDLLQHYVASDIAAAGNPIAIAAWPTDDGPVATFETADIPQPRSVIAAVVAQARRSRQRIVDAVAADTAVVLVMAAPAQDGGVTSVVLAPESRLFEPDPFARLYGLDVDPDVEPPYTVRLREGGPTPLTPTTRIIWRREDTQLHGDGIVQAGAAARPVHLEVELRSLNALIQRGTLIVLLDLTLVALLWFASVVADGGAGRWLRARRRTWGRSYRIRLSLALFVFFIVPATAFAIWSYTNLATDATRSRELLVNETLRAISLPLPPSVTLESESDRLGAPLFVYVGGELQQASDLLYDELAPIGRFLRPSVELSVDMREEETAAALERVEAEPSLFGFRGFDRPGGPSVVVAAPARADELPLGRRRRDLSILVLFATAVGAFAALWLSGVAAQQLARPIGSLREAALSIAAGAREPPLEDEPTVEFHPVFTAFRRMAEDLNASRTALEEAQRRTVAVLRNVASGVVAVDPDLRVALANPRAEALLGTSLIPGTAFETVAPPPVVATVARFLRSTQDDESFEVSLDQQQLRGTLTRLARGGAVVTVDDVTELARAQRVIAWGEMARQVAHEIKNPLTPIRLGVQHLRRARHDQRVDFDRVLDQNVNQILAEIDRLDEIARSFSRYGAAPEERPTAVAVDIAAIVREVVSLERMGEQHDLAWREQGADVPVFAVARADELKEVLLNVLENARLADARSVTASVDGVADDAHRVAITVVDDGRGIAPDVLPRVFEPHFSTRTSGSGLGLAISRRLVESWGGEISIVSEPGRGTTVTIALLRAAPG